MATEVLDDREKMVEQLVRLGFSREVLDNANDAMLAEILRVYQSQNQPRHTGRAVKKSGLPRTRAVPTIKKTYPVRITRRTATASKPWVPAAFPRPNSLSAAKRPCARAMRDMRASTSTCRSKSATICRPPEGTAPPGQAAKPTAGGCLRALRLEH